MRIKKIYNSLEAVLTILVVTVDTGYIGGEKVVLACRTLIIETSGRP